MKHYYFLLYIKAVDEDLHRVRVVHRYENENLAHMAEDYSTEYEKVYAINFLPKEECYNQAENLNYEFKRGGRLIPDGYTAKRASEKRSRYIIEQATIDATSLEDKGLTNCLSFGVSGRKVYGTKAEAENALLALVKTHLNDAKSEWPEEDGWKHLIGCPSDDPATMTLTSYSGDELMWQTTYFVERIEIE